MLRLLGAVLVGVGLVAVFVHAGDPPQRVPLTKHEYLSSVRDAANAEAIDRRFDEVVNYRLYPCIRVCSADDTTLDGRDWRGSEHLLRGELDAFGNRLSALRPPEEVARLHAAWISALTLCSASLRSLESRQKRFANGDFEREVAQEMRASCFERFDEIIPAFEAKGYVFVPARFRDRGPHYRVVHG
jgi:hypothetical protein